MTVILCENHRRAIYEFNEFVRKSEPLIEKADSHKLKVKLVNGFEYQFMSKQNSAEKLKGTHADEMYIDGFLKEQNT